MSERSGLEQLLNDVVEQLRATQKALAQAEARIRELEEKEEAE